MDIKNYLRDMDREEEDLRRQIMGLQIRIQQLNDARLVLMTREEERAHRAGHSSPFGSLGGGSIVVRDPLRMPAPSAAALAAPEEPSGQLGRPKTNQGKIAPSILEVIKRQGGVATSAEICDALEGQFERRLITKALYNGMHRGTFKREGDVYRKGNKPLSKRVGKPLVRIDPAVHEADRKLVLEVLAAAPEPLTSGQIIARILKGTIDKPRRDRLFHQIQRLVQRGEVVKTGKEYKLLALKQPEEDAA